MAKFKFDKRKLQKVVNQAAQAKGDELADQLTADLNALSPSCKGRPVNEVKVEVQKVWRRRMSSDLPEPKVTEFAETLAGGGSVRVTAAVK
ncbi:hypothetical protein GPZ77_34720 (plasmid) [Streptomyces sp. QHH-9511]|uniref:hypothetical protein n=1 Tax=Streptomyces sp. QHH-9511 TaxID=2684468 RepID=UPI001316F707|nr:hypothetical protein [Streptomyces sp. QHH-9511]QGZ53382.1 hypothetical protein GPZ77_34720 [Streptomyces sp. QHH-9511]